MLACPGAGPVTLPARFMLTPGSGGAHVSDRGRKRKSKWRRVCLTIALIALNVLAFLLEINQPSEAALQSFIEAWGVVPREYSAGQDLPPGIPVSVLDARC